MKYYTQEIWEDEKRMQRTAGTKARDDIAKILDGMGYQSIAVTVPEVDRGKQNALQKLEFHAKLRRIWDKSLKDLQKDDELVIQFPILNHSVLLKGSIEKLHRKGVKIILLIHDLEMLRWVMRDDISKREKLRLRLEEESLLNACDAMIVHNYRMKQKLTKMGFDENKMVVLGIFDYLVPDKEDNFAKTCADGPVVVAGVLRRHKAAYTYDLPSEPDYRLYGVGYEGEPRENVEYLGSFPPDDLPGVMEGKFGLVWDGDSTQTCAGAFGKYMRVNNPHKTSLYLSSGLPVVIWKDAALARFVEKNGCGITVESLQELPEKLAGISNEEYRKICDNTKVISAKMRDGYYTKRAVEKASSL